VTGAAGEIVQMHQNGVSAEVILAYIEESGRTFFLTPSEIVELNRAGIPSQLMVAMLRQQGQSVVPRTGSGVEGSRVETTSPATPPPQVSTEPLFVTGSQRREARYTPQIPPWVHGLGHYPYSYYRRYGAPSWRYSRYFAAHYPYSVYSYPGDCRIYKPRGGFHSRFSRHRARW
jgi:hypothetical protein